MPDNRELARSKATDAELVILASRLRAQGLAIPVPTAATYDTGTEGRTGLRFVLTPRWIAYIVAVILFATSCVLGVSWQWGQWRQLTSYNATVVKNFGQTPVPLATLVPTRGGFTTSERWRPITATGTYVVSQQLFVINRVCATIDQGFEVLTPLRLANGSELVVDRGCVAASATNTQAPKTPAAPPVGTVTVTARIVGSEADGGPVSGNQLESIDLAQAAHLIGGSVYTGAYAMLDSQSPAPENSLSRVISGRPILDSGVQTTTIFALALYVAVGVFIFGFALRSKFRWVNRFDPRLWMRELRRIQRLAKKAYTDEELEDLLIDRNLAAATRAIGPTPGGSGGPPTP